MINVELPLYALTLRADTFNAAMGRPVCSLAPHNATNPIHL
jgi:hypothetical protein